MSGYTNLHNLLNEYLNFVVEGKKVKIPYVMERSRMAFSKTSGKGTPQMLKDELIRVAKYDDFDLQKASEFEIYDFMREKRIGIDCSGLVFHLLSEYVRAEKDIELADVLVRKEGVLGMLEKKIFAYQRHRRINAATLTSPLNTVEVERCSEVVVGDLIRMSIKKPADHVLLVVDVGSNEQGETTSLTYAHSSSVNTVKRGPHTSDIKIVNFNAPLNQQEWEEKTKDGRTYDVHFHPERGDSVRRLKILT